MQNHFVYCIKKYMITTNPNIRSGQPTLNGSRLTVKDILEYLASGMTYEEVLRDFPELTRQDILDCLAYAGQHLR